MIMLLLWQNGGTRRKYHRAWTLSEVMKLVEGVSKYGAGRRLRLKGLPLHPIHIEPLLISRYPNGVFVSK